MKNNSARLLYVAIILFFFTPIYAAKKPRPNYISVGGLFPLSVFERDAIISPSLQLKYKKMGIDLEYGSVFHLSSYRQTEPAFEAKSRGSRLRLNLKYYLCSLPFEDHVDYHFYVSIMPFYKNIKYNMLWWEYDSLITNNTYTSVISHEHVTYNSHSIGANISFGNEFFLSCFNLDYYLGVGIKNFNLKIPPSAPYYFVPYSNPIRDGNYITLLAGAKIRFAYKLSNKR